MYYVYRITNTVNGKQYVGVRKHADPERDDYTGSGTLLRLAFKKYGPAAFTKEIVATFNDRAPAFELEQRIVDDAFLAREDVYNLRRGGAGGFDYINKTGKNRTKKHTRSQLAALVPTKIQNERRKARGEWNAYVSKMSRSVKTSQARLGNPFSGRCHSEAAKRKMRAKNSVLLRGKANGAYGTRWMVRGNVVERVSAQDVDERLAAGWALGRR